MATKRKTFNCVEMKRRGAQRIQAEIAGMTPAEELTFWQHGTAQLQERQVEKQAKRVKDGSARHAPVAASV